MKIVKLAALLGLVVSVMTACGGAIESRIGGKVTGLATDNTVELKNVTNGEKLSVAYKSGDITFEFQETVPDGGSYHVTVSTPPKGQTCDVENGEGMIKSNSGNIDNIVVSCKAGTGDTVPLTVNVVGLELGAQLVLEDIAAGKLTITGTAETQAGGTLNQTFPTQLALGTTYDTEIKTNSSFGPSCTINASTKTGTISGSSGSPSKPSPVVIICR